MVMQQFIILVLSQLIAQELFLNKENFNDYSSVTSLQLYLDSRMLVFVYG